MLPKPCGHFNEFVKFQNHHSWLKHSSTFVEESRIDDSARHGAIFFLNNSEHFIEYDHAGYTLFTRARA